MLLDLPFVAVGLIAVIGLGAMIAKKNLIKVILGLGLLEGAVNLFLVAVGYRQDGIAPIFTNAPEGVMVMPTVQALTLTAIVIGVATLALLLTMAMAIHRHYKTLNVERIVKLKG